MPTSKEDASKFKRHGRVLHIAYRDNEGDWLHAFTVPVDMLTNEQGDLVLLRGAFKFTHHTGFIDKPKRKRS